MRNEIDIALPSLAALAERVMPAVVNLSAALEEQAAAKGDENTENQIASPLGRGGTPFDQFLKRFFEQPFKIDTNENLTYVTWEKGDDAKVGDWVVAVGNPSGSAAPEPPGSSLRLGATSNRALMTISCQIDAPINRGNSGGPTFNLHGQVIGTNPAIYSVSGGSVRIGFAAPANIAKASSRPAQGTLARQPPLSSANLAVCDGDRAVAASPDGRPPAGTTALVLALTN